ncbi:hypothetical protein CBS101457_006780 [Exobasidium rhododendri]|nr:hypothetical protein CBS101457_006780 [Exobasidium rhododendri]
MDLSSFEASEADVETTTAAGQLHPAFINSFTLDDKNSDSLNSYLTRSNRFNSFSGFETGSGATAVRGYSIFELRDKDGVPLPPIRRRYSLQQIQSMYDNFTFVHGREPVLDENGVANAQRSALGQHAYFGEEEDANDDFRETDAATPVAHHTELFAASAPFDDYRQSQFRSTPEETEETEEETKETEMPNLESYLSRFSTPSSDHSDFDFSLASHQDEEREATPQYTEDEGDRTQMEERREEGTTTPTSKQYSIPCSTQCDDFDVDPYADQPATPLTAGPPTPSDLPSDLPSDTLAPPNILRKRRSIFDFIQRRGSTIFT